eukprot:jgi/Mesvir1/21595/Mv04027-RA.1
MSRVSAAVDRACSQSSLAQSGDGIGVRRGAACRNLVAESAAGRSVDDILGSFDEEEVLGEEIMGVEDLLVSEEAAADPILPEQMASEADHGLHSIDDSWQREKEDGSVSRAAIHRIPDDSFDKLSGPQDIPNR